MSEPENPSQSLPARRPCLPDVDELPGEASPWTGWARSGEVDTFDEFLRRFWAGELSPDEFKAFRLQNGVYGQSQQGVHMVRVKAPAGGLTAEQLEAMAALAERTPRGKAHVTTRQAFQLHFVPQAELTSYLTAINAAGLTTREACSNTVRNVTCCHKSGVCPGEPFDVSPYAAATARFFLRNPMSQALPRKFKITFGGCPKDCALPLIHDVGAMAAARRGANGAEERGFRLYLGGGLGSHPVAARLLEEFTPERDLLVTLSAVVRVFDRHGNREQKMMARMKYVVEKVGWEAFRTLVLKDREKVRSAFGGQVPAVEPWEERPASRAVEPSLPLKAPDAAAYARWRRTNVMAQKQEGYALVHVRLVLGDVTAAQLRALAGVVRRYSNGTLRTTVQQNFAVRWVPQALLPEVYAALDEVGLALPGAERLVDVTACPGADTCQIGITSSRGLARALTARLESDLARFADESGVRIKISGCPNSCGQHHIAPIGLFGGARKVGDRAVPIYQLMLGGKGADPLPGSPFAEPVARIPAQNVCDAVARLLELWEKERGAGEEFVSFVERVGAERLRAALEEFTRTPSIEQAPHLYRDVATPAEEVGRGERFIVKVGKGECAA